MESLGTLFASILSLVLGFSVWKLLEKVGLLKTSGENLTDQTTDRALKSTSAGLDTLERVIDSLEKRIQQQEADYNEDLDRLKVRYEEDTRLLKLEIDTLRDLLRTNQDKIVLYESILVEHNLLPDEG